MKNTIPTRRIFSIFMAAFLFFGTAFAVETRITVPESTSVRNSVLESWILAPLSQVNGRPYEIKVDPTGLPFQIRADREGQSTVIVVSPQTIIKGTNLIGDSVDVVDTVSFSRSSRGSWLLYRNRTTGAAEKIIIFFTENPEIYLQLRPNGKKTLADMMVYGSYLSRGVPLTIPFENLFTTSFQSILNQTKKTLPWATVVPGENSYENVKNMIPQIRRRLMSVVYTEDTAYNEYGELYTIVSAEPFGKKVEDEALNYWLKNPVEEVTDETKRPLSAPGFVKWIVDGMVRPYTRQRNTRISDLIASTVENRTTSKNGVQSQAWNFTLNLDWNRHLAANVYSLHTMDGRRISWDKCGVDVVENYFVSTLADDGRILPYVGYKKNIGYATSDLKSLMYVLAVEESDSLFLGAVMHFTPDSAKGPATLFDSNAVFIPYFRESGVFDCVVFQNGKDMTLEQFIRNNPSAFVHFERVKASPEYDLQ